MRVITWNVFHGRSIPERRHDLYDSFAATIAGWEWDALLLQEVPPWWPEPLARELGAQARMALTSRNFGLAVRRAIARRRPDLLKANGGGCNAILVRDQGIEDHRHALTRRLPERRLVHGVRLASGTWICNLHLQGARSHLVRADPIAEIARAAQAAILWAGPTAPIVLAGDWNVSQPMPPGFTHVPGHRGVDQLFARHLPIAGRAEALPHGTLSDHRPVAATFGTRRSPEVVE